MTATSSAELKTLGFIGLGVMGEPMCRHVLQHSQTKALAQVYGFDLSPAPLDRLSEFGLERAESIAELVEKSDLILLSLPGGDELSALCHGKGGLLELARSGQTIVDLGTSPLGMTRELQAAFAEQQVSYADAPVARTRAAAEAGTLVVLVGAEPDLFDRIQPYLDCFAEEVVHCGPIGAGQVVKQMNNMVLFQTVTALAEALATARNAGVDGEVLFKAMMQGSGDSFALRNHGLKALLPDVFPERAFSTRYARKDISYAIDLGAELGLDLTGAKNTKALFDKTIAAGLGEAYFPSVLKIIDGSTEKDD